MNIEIAKKAASLIERIDEIEKIIFELENVKNGKEFNISTIFTTGAKTEIFFKEGKLSTEIFKQNIINYMIDNFNVELKELVDELDELK